MKQVLIRGGHAVVTDVPAPAVEAGTVLVRVSHSCISSGTELSGLRMARDPLWRRAMRQPDKVKRVIDIATREGVGAARDIVAQKLAASEATGYSAAGIVIEKGADVPQFEVGDRVACAGAQFAHHAQVIRVPRNLTVPIPKELGFAEASTVTLGAIALQGVRRATPTIGESFVVIGLGILGQLTSQLLRAAGCRVIVTDLDQTRVSLATTLGAHVGLPPGAGATSIEQVARLTDGIGADGVIITASSASDEVVSTAFRMCRRKGRVVLVGDVGLDLNREDLYAKELDFFISTSYGPGRYDRRYEEEGVDYPVGYVRWTENRNMAEYLRLLSEGRVDLAGIIGAEYPIEAAAAAYEALESGPERSIVSLLRYPIDEPVADRVVANPRSRSRTGDIGVALVGAGAFAKGMHLPNMRALDKDLHLQAVVSRTGHNAVAVAEQYGAAYATTDYGRVLDDPDVDLVVIATRHNLHAEMALRALQNGKHVLVEKPLALTPEELDTLVGFFDAGTEGTPVLMTGFNRRFAPFVRQAADLIAERTNPMIATYHMNVGYIPLDHWVHGSEGGGRNRGEACHIYDLFTFLTGARVTSIDATAIKPATAYYSPSDNFVATARFDDGSVASLAYTALGNTSHPKEQLEVFVDGRVIVLDDYKRLTVSAPGGGTTTAQRPDKGQRAELEALVAAIRGGPWPIPLWQQVQATEIAISVEDMLVGSV